MFKNIYKTIPSNIYFISIYKDNNTIFNWKSENCVKHFFFDLLNTQQTGLTKRIDIYHHIDKGDVKIVYLKSSKMNLTFIAGANEELQFQILEALLDYLQEQFLIKYGTLLENLGEQGTGNNKLFNDFNSVIENSLTNFQTLNLITFTTLFCNACKANHTLAVKKSLIQKAKGGNIPLVYTHSGVTLLVYLDHEFNVRGVEIVNLA